MYRIALKTKRGLKIGLRTLTLVEARGIKEQLNMNKNTKCIIITESYVNGSEDFREIL